MQTLFFSLPCLVLVGGSIFYPGSASAACLRAKYKSSVQTAEIMMNNSSKKERFTSTTTIDSSNFCLDGDRFTSDKQNISAKLNAGRVSVSEIKDGVPAVFFLEARQRGNIYTFIGGFTGEFAVGKGVYENYIKFRVEGNKCTIIDAYNKTTNLNRSALAWARNEKFAGNIYCMFD
ncbi:hypothetical protein [Methylobacterium aerolatum]|uniref:Uncharacterized protein n=1 Tax=Methylobacterium aerolatum TaxID=418708 RepID=A0ABU0I3B6_9HYPH|nr:hypothetical protein [Methylobacterium aerolatum]MDQ0448587.1 hypothetical protein [Methylobacterium aerolatum]